MSENIAIGTDPGGAAILKHWISSGKISASYFDASHLEISKFKSGNTIWIGTSVGMEYENYVLEKAETASVIFVIDEVYSVKDRLAKIDSKFISKIFCIYYVSGTDRSELMSNVEARFFDHPVLTKEYNKDFPYNFELNGVNLLVDEFKVDYQFIDPDIIFGNGYLSELFEEQSNFKIRSHPLRKNSKVKSLNDGNVSCVLGYTSIFLVSSIVLGFPTYSCASKNQPCFLNQATVIDKSSKPLKINGMVFKKRSLSPEK